MANGKAYWLNGEGPPQSREAGGGGKLTAGSWQLEANMISSLCGASFESR